MSDDDDDTFFVIILPVTIVIFISIFSYLFVGYMRLKKHLLNSGQVISAVPFLILPDEQPEIRSPDGQLPPPAYNTLMDAHSDNCNDNNNSNNNNSGLNYNHHPNLSNFTLPDLNTGRRERYPHNNRRYTQPVNTDVPLQSMRGMGRSFVSQGELEGSGPPSTEIMLERPPPSYSIESTTEVPTRTNDRNDRRRGRKQSRTEQIAMSDIAPPPYTAAPEVQVN